MQIQILFDVAITPNLAVGNNQSFGTPDLVLLADGTVLLTATLG